jgi:hypothetical protein
MSQLYLLPCSCGQATRVAVAQAGGEVVCACGNRLQVPTMRGIRQLKLAPAEAIAKQAPGWSRVHGTLFAAGMVAAVIGVSIVAFCFLQYARIRFSYWGDLSKDRTADVTKAMAADIDRLTPVETLQLWTEEIHKEGLGEVETPPWIKFKEKLNEYVWWIRAGGAAILSGVIVSMLTLFIGRRATGP